MKLGITRFLLEKWKRRKSSMAIRWCISAVHTERSDCESGNWKIEIGKWNCGDCADLKLEALSLVMPSKWIALGAVDGAPAIGHFATEFPEFGEEFVAHAVFQYFYGATFQGFCAEA